jgi:hypothetical protein
MAVSTAKISVSIGESELDWAKKRAEREGVSLSAVVTEAVRLARQHEARVRVVGWLGRSGVVAPRRETEILAEWGERAETGGPVKAKKPRGKRLRHS